jgi:Tol biopolymer transport system component
MSFVAGTQFGPYEIIGLIGAGGMGEVYRARDTRLLREVALKVLPPSFTGDPDRLRRFEQEARAVAALNHPNIVSVHDVGTGQGVQYIVSELLDGDTLRSNITPSGMPPRRVIELGIQLAHGLAAAHDHGIVHRDLKPENIFITRAGRLKILDFGVAKLQRPPSGAETMAGVTRADTDAGQILGTVGYMSPEQVRGEPADQRSDIFSVGSILYELLTGQRAFRRQTAAETMTAILNDDAPDVTGHAGAMAPALERIVRHCLAKHPSQRFQSAHDLALALESLSGVTGGVVPSSAVARKRKPWVASAAVAGALLSVGMALVAWLRPPAPQGHPTLHRLTFRRGTVRNARFTPEGTIVYSAAWEGRPLELFAAESGSTESRPLSLPTTSLLAISGAGELAVSMNPQSSGFELVGMLARASRGGAAPREIADNVEFVDWSPDGVNLAVIRRVGGKVRLEYPLGKVLYETAGWVSHLRVSPDGKSVAFIDHPVASDDAGAIAVIDQAGQKRTLTRQFVSAQGLAWAPEGTEVWFTATTSGSNRQLHAISLSGQERLVYTGTGTLTLFDMSKSGRVLLSRDDFRAGIIGLSPGERVERDLSWHDWSITRDLSDDGRLVVFDETGEAGGETGGLYIRRTDGSPAVRLGDGHHATLSPDGKWVLARAPRLEGVIMLPTGAGEARTIATGDVQVQRAFFFPDGRRILEVGSTRDRRAVRLWVQNVTGGAPRPISPEGVGVTSRACITPDGTQVAAQDPERTITIYPVEAGTPASVLNTQAGDEPIQWTADGRSLMIGRRDVVARAFLIDPTSGQRTPFKTFSPPDPSGVTATVIPRFSRDLKSYVYSYTRITSDLYMVDGLK